MESQDLIYKGRLFQRPQSINLQTRFGTLKSKLREDLSDLTQYCCKRPNM